MLFKEVKGRSSGGNCEESVASKVYNIDTDGPCALTEKGDLSKVSPKLGPLKNHGGATFTHALLPGSPAIDAGDPAGCTDHNGVALETDRVSRFQHNAKIAIRQNLDRTEIYERVE